jgi:hypothetical protein
VRDDLLEMNFERAIAREQVVEVAVEEAVLPDLLEQQVQEQPNVVDVGLPVTRHGQDFLDFVLEAGEDRFDDFVLVVEVVVQIARADAEVVGDDGRRYVGLAEIVKKPQAGFQDAFACPSLRFAFHAPARRSAGCFSA